MNKSALALAGFASAAGLVLFIVAQPLLEPAPTPPPSLAMVATPTTQEASSIQRETFPKAKRAIARTLKDPDSARFGSLFQGRRMSGKLTVCGEVNAKNGFGKYSGVTPFIYFVEDDMVMLITDPPDPRFLTAQGLKAFFKDCRG